MNGICAACGKLGALFGSSTFPILVASRGYSAVFLVCAAISLLGAFLTYFFVVDARGSANESKEMKRARLLVDQPWDAEKVSYFRQYGDHRQRLGLQGL